MHPAKDEKYHFEADLNPCFAPWSLQWSTYMVLSQMIYLIVAFVIQNLFNMIIGQRECMEVTTDGERIKQTILRY